MVKAEKTFEGVDEKTMLSGIHCVFQQRNSLGLGGKRGVLSSHFFLLVGNMFTSYCMAFDR